MHAVAQPLQQHDRGRADGRLVELCVGVVEQDYWWAGASKAAKAMAQIKAQLKSDNGAHGVIVRRASDLGEVEKEMKIRVERRAAGDKAAGEKRIAIAIEEVKKAVAAGKATPEQARLRIARIRDRAAGAAKAKAKNTDKKSGGDRWMFGS